MIVLRSIYYIFSKIDIRGLIFLYFHILLALTSYFKLGFKTMPIFLTLNLVSSLVSIYKYSVICVWTSEDVALGVNNCTTLTNKIPEQYYDVYERNNVVLRSSIMYLWTWSLWHSPVFCTVHFAIIAFAPLSVQNLNAL